MLSEDGITVRQALQITSATKSALSGHSPHRNILSAIGVTADIGPGSPPPMTLGNMRANGVRPLCRRFFDLDHGGLLIA
jgi:hypothetical protein